MALPSILVIGERSRLKANVRLILLTLMRAARLCVFCALLTCCMKRTTLDPLPHITRVVVDGYENPGWIPPDAGDKKVAPLIAYMNGLRSGWTRAYGVGFGPPSPAYYAHLFDGDRYVGYFAVGAGVLPGSAAFFQVQYGDVFAQKRVTKAEANRFLDLVGVGGELSENVDHEVRQQTVNQPPTSRAAALIQPKTKFQPGDRVRVKLSRAEGTVCLQTKFFREDLYFITFPGSYDVFEPVADRTQREAWRAESEARSREWARSHGMAESAFDVPEYQPTPWHDEGPFYESDLEPLPK
jgi:hypothetical protein